MQITQDWTRKRSAHSTACWDCYRCHRACDGTRPCKRCFDLGRGASCRDPAPNERIPRKRKKINRNTCEDLPDGRPPPHKIRKPCAKNFFMVDPQMYMHPLPEPNNATPLTPSLPSTSRSTTTTAFDHRPWQHGYQDPGAPQEGIVGFYEEHKKIWFYQPPRTDLQSTEIARTQDTKHQQLIQHPSSFCAKQHTQFTMTDDFPLFEELLAEFRAVETEETEAAPDHRETTSSFFQSLTIPDDLMQLTASLFSPFCLLDSTQVLFSTVSLKDLLTYPLSAIHCVQANCGGPGLACQCLARSHQTNNSFIRVSISQIHASHGKSRLLQPA